MTSVHSTTIHYHHPCSFVLTGNPTSRFTLSATSSDSPHLPSHLRRPKTLISPPSPSKPPFNPLQTLRFSQNTPDLLTPKLRLTKTLSPPPPPLPPPPPAPKQTPPLAPKIDAVVEEFRQEGKIFVGNLPLWVKKPELTEFFRQFGPIKSVILVKGHDELERNLGFGFVIFDGVAAEKAALKAVEFDGVEFHGRVLTVKLDDGRRLRNRGEERERWVEEGGEKREYRSKWHETREDGRKAFRRVLDSVPENWQAVIRAFESIKKV